MSERIKCNRCDREYCNPSYVFRCPSCRHEQRVLRTRRPPAIDRESRPAAPVDTALGGHSSDNASEGFTILSTALGPAIEVHPEYHKATDTDKLLCLQNVQSWIDGERKRLRTPTESKE